MTDVTDPECDCPAGVHYNYLLPCGAGGTTYVPPGNPCHNLPCDSSGAWSLTALSCLPEKIDEATCNNGGGLFTAPAAGECCGTCDCNPTAIYLGEEACENVGGTWTEIVFHCSGADHYCVQ